MPQSRDLLLLELPLNGQLHQDKTTARLQRLFAFALNFLVSLFISISIFFTISPITRSFVISCSYFCSCCGSVYLVQNITHPLNLQIRRSTALSAHLTNSAISPEISSNPQ